MGRAHSGILQLLRDPLALVARASLIPAQHRLDCDTEVGLLLTAVLGGRLLLLVLSLDDSVQFARWLQSRTRQLSMAEHVSELLRRHVLDGLLLLVQLCAATFDSSTSGRL